MSELIYSPQNLWTTIHEKLLLKWRTNAIGLEWQHRQASEFYEYSNYVLGSIAIVLTMITSASFFIDLSNDASCSNDIYKKIAFGSILTIASILTAINTFFKYNELSEKHKNCSDRWRTYINNIDTELSFSKEERINGKVFIKQMQKRYNELIEICPNIPKYIQKKYDKNNMKNKLTELNEIVIDETFIRYQQKDNNDNNDNKSEKSVGSDESDSKPDIQKELEDELKGKQIKENVSKYIEDSSKLPLSRLINI